MSEVGVNVVLCAAQPRFQRCYEGILADLYQAGGTSAFLVDDGRATGDDGFLGDAIEIAGATLDVGSGLIEVVPSRFRKGKPLVWFYRFCFYLLHDFPFSFQGIEVVPGGLKEEKSIEYCDAKKVSRVKLKIMPQVDVFSRNQSPRSNL